MSYIIDNKANYEHLYASEQTNLIIIFKGKLFGSFKNKFLRIVAFTIG